MITKSLSGSPKTALDGVVNEITALGREAASAERTPLKLKLDSAKRASNLFTYLA